MSSPQPDLSPQCDLVVWDVQTIQQRLASLGNMSLHGTFVLHTARGQQISGVTSIRHPGARTEFLGVSGTNNGTAFGEYRFRLATEVDYLDVYTLEES